MSLSVKEVAELLVVDENAIHAWVVSGRIPYHRVGGEVCFFTNELRDWAVAAGYKIDKRLPKMADNTGLSLAAAVGRGGVFTQLDGREPTTLIGQLMAAMRLPEHIERAEILAKVLEREKMASTAIGSGIAVPHMHASLDSIETPYVACGLLHEPVAWGNGTVNIVFLPLCPNMRNHLNLLMKIASLGKNPHMLELLSAGSAEAEALEVLTEVDRVTR